MNRIRIHVLPSSRNRVTQTPRPQEPQACSFTQRPCSQPRLEGLEFCIKHILEDKNAPYKQCSYVSAKNGKRCPNAAPKAERKDGWVEGLNQPLTIDKNKLNLIIICCESHQWELNPKRRGNVNKLISTMQPPNFNLNVCSVE